MENASKAIIIGGSVLISILIVSLGIYIYNSTKDTTGKAEEATVSLEVQLYNQKFEKYFDGDKTSIGQPILRGSDIKELISEAISSKADIIINIKTLGEFGGDSEKTLSNALLIINDNYTWHVNNIQYDDNGRISKIVFMD